MRVRHGSRLLPERTTQRRAAAITVFTSVLAGATFIATPAEAITKSRAKSKVVAKAPTRYTLSIQGSYSVTAGDATESGSVTAPSIAVQIVTAGGKTLPIGSGTGRGASTLSIGTGCSLSGTLIYDIIVVGPLDISSPQAPPLTLVPGDEPAGDDALLAELGKPAVIPRGFVGLSAVLTPPVQDRPTKSCTFPGPVTKTVSIGALGMIAAMENATTGLMFPTAGGTVKVVNVNNPSYEITFTLRRR